MLRKLLWTIIFVGGYVWLVSTGHEDIVLDRGKALYKALVSWLDDAEFDFQLKKDKPKKRSRRWD